ncbi:phosphoribosylanthranilate isomerase [Actibacterium mucosum KCTC 23349]|uniref:Phosphoribosylanthranilate isomerase n=1 Tax=Actibacterium mucosum KCTC 23349 TaxID=1454373 RepID=A0A037ZIL6_9RHOB|nr:lipopolysaccharide assembly protein LapA domain-containing protein [Actibacterium mucosum]KAJ55928.1 phosphoribosylanthranilate isomerase [Actibacterium mucosum KCTC 23349]
MFRYLRYLIWGLLALVLVVVALANRGPVTLNLLPAEMATFAGFNLSLQLPLFLVVLAAVVVGLLVGFGWEGLREMRIRGQRNRAQRDAASLKREVDRLKGSPKQADDVLALLEDGGKAG